MMEYWSEKTHLDNPTEFELRSTLQSEQVSDGWIGQIQNSDTDYLHTMAMEKSVGDLGFYLERRGPTSGEWYEGVSRSRSRTILAKPWWQFWGKAHQVFLFDREEMIEIFCAFRNGDNRPARVIWQSIPPSY